MKPRPSEAPLLTKAREIEHRLNQLEIIKGKDCPHCKDGKLDKAGMCKAGCKPSHKMAKAEGHEAKIKECLKKKGGAASLEECAKECGVSPEECKKVIDKMDDVKISPHGDVVLMDGLQKADMATKDKYCMVRNTRSVRRRKRLNATRFMVKWLKPNPVTNLKRLLTLTPLSWLNRVDKPRVVTLPPMVKLSKQKTHQRKRRVRMQPIWNNFQLV